MRVVNVAVGCPAASVAIEEESESHGGNSWVGAVMRGTIVVAGGAGTGAVEVRWEENVDSSSQTKAVSRIAERKKNRDVKRNGEGERVPPRLNLPFSRQIQPLITCKRICGDSPPMHLYGNHRMHHNQSLFA